MSLGNIQSVKPTILGSKERWVERKERRAGDRKEERRGERKWKGGGEGGGRKGEEHTNIPLCSTLLHLEILLTCGEVDESMPHLLTQRGIKQYPPHPQAARPVRLWTSLCRQEIYSGGSGGTRVSGLLYVEQDGENRLQHEAKSRRASGVGASLPKVR